MTSTTTIGAALGEEIAERIDLLAGISESAGQITRVFLSAEHRAAAELIQSWMEAAGMAARIDAIGNVIGRYEGDAPKAARAAARLAFRHACATPANGMARSASSRRSPASPTSTAAASGCRSPLKWRRSPTRKACASHPRCLAAAPLAGTFDESVLATRDRDGVSHARGAARRSASIPTHIGAAARAPSEFLAYLELHIEQGPVLEAEGLPRRRRHRHQRRHAPVRHPRRHGGTRRHRADGDADAMRSSAPPNASSRSSSNARTTSACSAPSAACAPTRARPTSFPGRCAFTVDMRCASDQHRRLAVASAVRTIERLAKMRGLKPQIDVTLREPHGRPARTGCRRRFRRRSSGRAIAPWRCRAAPATTAWRSPT